MLFLINAIYFKGRWRVQFDPAETRSQPFHGADGRDRTVPMMSLNRTLAYASGPDLEVAELLYGNGAFAMTLILPAPGTTPAQVLGRLDAAAWRALTGQLRDSPLTLGLPRFRLEDTREAQFPEFDAVKPQIVQRLQQMKLQKYQEDLRKSAKTDFKFSQ